MSNVNLARYEISKTYDWNYENAPDQTQNIQIPICPGNWEFCGLPVDSPLGIPAGPLLNSRWILYYAMLGFSVLTYKTVRSVHRESYGPPNLLPVHAGQLQGSCDHAYCATKTRGSRSWAISFGMPSKDPALWQEDVTLARRGMTKGQVLVVSVAASPDPDWKIEQIVRDYAQCARWARDAGAQAIEANLSCPNVCTKEGHLYSSAEASALIAAAMRDAASGLPVILKVGLFPNRDQMAVFVEAVGSHATALSTTNCIPATVSQPDGSPLFEGLSRGIGGECIRERCQAEIKMLKDVIDAAGSKLKLIGVGGMFSSADVRERMTEGAHHVQLATAAMLDPLVAIRIRRERAVAVDRVAGKRF